MGLAFIPDKEIAGENPNKPHSCVIKKMKKEEVIEDIKNSPETTCCLGAAFLIE